MEIPCTLYRAFPGERQVVALREAPPTETAAATTGGAYRPGHAQARAQAEEIDVACHSTVPGDSVGNGSESAAG